MGVGMFTKFRGELGGDGEAHVLGSRSSFDHTVNMQLFLHQMQFQNQNLVWKGASSLLLCGCNDYRAEIALVNLFVWQPFATKHLLTHILSRRGHAMDFISGL